jgi:hypothetical protein
MLINKTHCRAYALEAAKQERAHRFTRVSPDVYEDLNRVVANWLRARVKSQPSKGQTIR